MNYKDQGSMGKLHVIIQLILLLIEIFANFSYCSSRNCSPWPAKTNMQCVGNIPEFKAGNPVQNLVLRRCTPGFNLSKASFNNLNNLNRLEILCEFKHNSSELIFDDDAFDGFGDKLEFLFLDHNNIAMIPDGLFCNTSELYKVTLTNNRLKDIGRVGFGSNVCGTEKDISKLKFLPLKNNLLSSVKNNTFDRLKQLNYLDISHNHLHEIEDDAFIGLNKLYQLDLSYNHLTCISDQAFRNLNLMEELYLSNNKLNSSTIIGVNQHLTTLITFNISNNEIELIDEDSFRNLTELATLDLSNNSLNFMGSPFLTLSLLENLHLDGIGANQLSGNIFVGLKILKMLYLRNNQLQYLEPYILHPFLELNALYLSGNQFTTVPDLNFVLHVDRLFLDNNLIENISLNSFNKFNLLTVINLSGNKIRQISKGTFNNTFLREIDLSRNMIETIDKDSLKKPNIGLLFRQWYVNTLKLDHNQIKEFDSNFSEIRARNISITFNRLKVIDLTNLPTNIEVLNVSYNEIHSLRKSKFLSYNPDMIAIDLSNNKLTRITSQDLPSGFQYVYLHNNLIEYFSPDFISHKLKYLTLHGNKLNDLCLPTENYYVYNLIHLSVTISGNPFSCSCELEWLTRLVPTREEKLPITIKDLEKVDCELPFSKSSGSRKVYVKGSRDSENFLCKSNHTQPNSCNCLVHKSWCQLPCPESCTCYQNPDNHILILDCSRQNLTIIPERDFIDHEVETLIVYLDGSLIEQISWNDFDNYSDTKKLFLNNSAISEIEEGALDKLTNLLEIYLNNNKLISLPDLVFSKLVKLRELHLSNNKLFNLAPNMFSSLPNLQLLTIENNSLTNFPVWNLVQLKSLHKLTLGGNPWTCDCEYVRQFREWLQQGQYPWNLSTYVKDAEKLTCQDSSEGFIPIMSYELEHCQVNYFYTWTSVLGTLVFLTTLCICIFLYRHELQVLVYTKYGFRLFYVNEAEDDANKIYDVFVSYSSQDDEFVAYEFLPKLEEIANPYRVCLHQRDFMIGGHIMNNIIDSVHNSRRTIVLVSENFVKSQWCKFEFKVAHCQMIEDRRNRVIMVLKGEIPKKKLEPEMKLYMTTNTYLKWEDKRFWDKLYFALPETRLVNLQTNHAFEQ